MHVVSSRVIRLSEVPEGATVRLHDMHLDPQSRLQLRGLGLTDRSPLRVCKQGEPCVVQVRTTRIGVSGSIAQEVFVVIGGDGARECSWR